ncbi:MAG: PTS sugar transporter subunit IIC [Spirochaetota bacterium]|nr:PTS sugar transporter subunit IIC [Spirochaetota bacterium]
MKSFMDRLLIFGEIIGNQRHLRSISTGMMMTLPFMVVGAFFLIIANPPIQLDLIDINTSNILLQILINWKKFTITHYDVLVTPFHLTMGMIGLLNAFTIAYTLAQEYKLNTTISGLISTITFLMVVAPIENGNISIEYLGTNGLFTAIIVSLLSVEITKFIKNKKIEFTLDKSIPPAIAVFINSLLPLLLNILIIYGISLVVFSITGVIFPVFIMESLSPVLFIGNNLFGYIAILVFGNILWIFGINGTSIIFPILFSLGINNTGINTELFNSGQEPTMVMNLQMFRYYALGGAGNTLGLTLLMLNSKVAQMRTVGKIAIIPGICGINEPIIFGLPIVLNPILGIPFILMPIITSLIGFYAQELGFVSLGYMVDPSFTPFFIQMFLSALDWRNVLLSFFIVFVSVLVYLPFFKLYEKQISPK